MRFPDVYKNQIAFSYAGDLWLVPASGGIARRITTHPGLELFPKFSPDGKEIAFTAQYDGNFNVYVMPAAGGEPKQLTYLPDVGHIPERMGPNNEVITWLPDGKRILFLSRRHTFNDWFGTLFTVSAEGGLPQPLPIDKGGLTSFSPDGTQIAYNRIFRNFRTWKRYKGGMAQDIALYDFKNNRYQRLTDYPGADTFPMWHGNTIYFDSDRGADNRMNLYAYDLQSKQIRQVTHFNDFDVNWPSLGPDSIVFENGGYLYLLDLASEQYHKLTVYLPGDLSQARTHWVNPSKWITAFDLSPEGKRAVFSARGDVFTVPAKMGSIRDLTRTSGARENYATWSPDGRWIAYLSDRSGEEEIYIVPQDGSAAETRITFDGNMFRLPPVWSPDSKKLLFADKSLRLFYVSIEDKKPVQIDQGKYADLTDYSWSPDSRWVAYAKASQNTNNVLYLYSLADRKISPLTSDFQTSWNPIFDPGGKYLYFLSNRDYNEVLGAYDLEFANPKPTRIYAVTLRKDTPSPFAPESDEETGKAPPPAEQVPHPAPPPPQHEKQPKTKKQPKKQPPPTPIPGQPPAANPPPGNPNQPPAETPPPQPTPPGQARSGAVASGTPQGVGQNARAGYGQGSGYAQSAGAEYAQTAGNRENSDPKSYPANGLSRSQDNSQSDSRNNTVPEQNAQGSASGEPQENAPMQETPATQESAASKEDQQKIIKEFRIDLAGIGDRIVGFPIPPGVLSSLAASHKFVYYITAPVTGLSGPLPEETPAVHAFDMKERKDHVLVDGADGYALAFGGKKLLYAAPKESAGVEDEAGAGDHQYGIVDAEPKEKPYKISGSALKLGSMRMEVHPREEWRQIFNEVYRQERDYFFEPSMNGVNWAAMRDKYAQLLPFVGTRFDLNYVLGELIGELANSHTYVGEGDYPDLKPVNVGVLGGDLAGDAAHGLYRVQKIYHGENWSKNLVSPLTEPGVDVREGDYLLAVNGQPLRMPQNPYAAFVNTAGENVTLTVNDKPSEEGARQVVVKAIGSEFKLRELNWINSNRAKVDKASGGRLGYIYLPDMSESGLNEFVKQFFPQIRKEGLILDARYNGGGFVDELIFERLRRILTGMGAARNWASGTYPDVVFYGPMADLSNEYSASDGDFFTYFFKKYKLGPVIGMRTWGGVRGIRGEIFLIDGGYITRPEFSLYGLDSQWVIENRGVAPDIEVDNTPDQVMAGHDPQLEKAIELLMKEISAHPRKLPPRPPDLPAYPAGPG